MSNNRKSLKKVRTNAYNHQNEKCYYCGHSMWNSSLNSFAKSHSISTKQAQYFQCTGEHLVPHSEGGNAKRRNIVAACLFCNRTRHKVKNALSAVLYKQKVKNRVKKGAWNCGLIV